MSGIKIEQIKNLVIDKLHSYQEAYKQTQSGEKSASKDTLQTLQKSEVLQDSKCFHEQQLNYKKCIQILTRLIYLINQGQTLSDLESQNLFFSITKLFSYENRELRRMMYLMIKEFKDQNSVFIVTASLIKDISSKTDLFRMNALRTLPLIIDQSNLVSIDRLIKMALIDKNYSISSSALLAGVQIYKDNQEIVKKWYNEVNERLTSKNVHNHYHALVLLNIIRSADRMSFNKIIMKCITENNYSPLTTIQVVRFINSILRQGQLEEQIEANFVQYLQRLAHKSNDMIVFEVCKTLCEIPNISNSDLRSIISILNMFIQSMNNVQKFMALQIINKLIQNPARHTLIQNTSDIESLISDQNKGLSSLAVSILLKLCQEHNIDKLLSSIYDNLSDMSDEFKQDVLKSVSQLIKTSPAKYKTVLNFLSNCLKKSEGSYNFKKYAIDIFENIISEIPASKELAFSQLAEYIEDCQYPYLQLQILSLINRESLQQYIPNRIIRQINNRIHLENSEIRAAALSIVGKMGQKYEDQKECMANLLRQTQKDLDEEVRERGLYYLELIEEQTSILSKEATNNLQNINLNQLDGIEQYIKEKQSEQGNLQEETFLAAENIEPYTQKQEKLQEQQQYSNNAIDSYEDIESPVKQEPTQLEKNQEFEKYQALFQNHEVFNQYGTLRKMTISKELTEKDCEYQISIKKFFFDDFIVFEFQVNNNVSDRVMKDLRIEIQPDNENIKQLHSIPAEKVNYNDFGFVYIGLQKNPEEKIVPTNIESYLYFTAEEVDHNNNVQQSYDDDFQIDDFQISVNEYFSKLPLPKGKFDLCWEAVQQEPVTNQFILRFKSLDHGVKEIIKHFDIYTCDETFKIKDPKKPHLLLLSGKYLDVYKVLIQIKIAYDANRGGCLLKIQVKSENDILSDNVANSISI